MKRPETIKQAAELVRSASRITPVGAGSKHPSGDSEGVLETTGLNGIVEYEPSEYTFTALAGTSIAEINANLNENGQYLPFDPPLAKAGATLGGTVASGLSGPGRLRYGGLRDFILGIRFLDGEGRLIQGGGKVVKNAAGFDYPKLFCGAMGSLGILVETTFKVFPYPRATYTLELLHENMDDAIASMCKITGSNWEPDALELIPEQSRLLLRLAGNPNALEKRIPMILEHFKASESRELSPEEAGAAWRSIQEFEWCPKDSILLKVPITPLRIPALEPCLSDLSIPRHYGMAGNIGWLAIPEPDTIEGISGLLSSQGLTAVSIRGRNGRHSFGKSPTYSIQAAVKQALDPLGKFPDFL